MMDATVLTGGTEFLVMAPMVGLVLFSLFRVDSLLSRPKHPLRRPIMSHGEDADGMPIFAEPDGRPLKPVHRRR